MKNCTKCNMVKSFDNFGKNKSYQDGLQYWCKLCHANYKKHYYNDNLQKSQIQRLQWKKNNKEKVDVYRRKYLSERYQKDSIFRILKNQRNRVKEILTNKPCSLSKSIGCSSLALKAHLESLFQPGMTWDNYGLYGWHVDHIIPLSHFDLTNAEEFKIACHYTNLQPLWAKDNIEKSNKILTGDINASS